MGAVLKTAWCESHGGSNPSSSENTAPDPDDKRRTRNTTWRDDREAEGARLLSECRVKNLTEGSNPSLSERTRDENDAAGFVLGENA